jgi:hypothetical protein
VDHHTGRADITPTTSTDPTHTDPTHTDPTHTDPTNTDPTNTSVPDHLSTPDLTAEDIAEAVTDLSDGRTTRARRRLGALWAQVEAGSPHQAAVAHWLGVAEPDLEAKVRWDGRALEAAEGADDWTMPFAGTGLTLGGMYPELHLELARDYRRLGSSCGAMEHLALARNAVEMSAENRRRTSLQAQIRRLDREICGMRERYPDPDDDDFINTDFPDVDLTDDEGTG